MSARPNAPLTSAEKITRYAHAISSNTSNLVTELNRVSAPVPPSNPDNEAILRQLQTISSQLAKINTRLDALEQPRPQLVDDTDTVGLQGLELWCSASDYYALPTAEYVPISLTSHADHNTEPTTRARVSTIPQCGTALPRCSLCTTAITSQSSASLPRSGTSHNLVFHSHPAHQHSLTLQIPRPKGTS